MFKKIIIILVGMLLLIGCENIEEENKDVETIQKCAYQYTYSCGYDVLNGNVRCGWGYFYICNTYTEEV